MKSSFIIAFVMAAVASAAAVAEFDRMPRAFVSAYLQTLILLDLADILPSPRSKPGVTVTDTAAVDRGATTTAPDSAAATSIAEGLAHIFRPFVVGTGG
ncbi:hypothetical protein GE09DRAFT_127836 [Coniochaeta sp. 2T2.1]|nr:hypothetical protein GE09DRAFT_127836 [Coniochaeta sp. 2T2.1]